MNPTGLEGAITITADWEAGAPPNARLRFDRPAIAASALIGRPAGEAPAFTRTLFGLCGAAHAGAARLALAAAGASERIEPAPMAAAILAERVAGGLRDFVLAFAEVPPTAQEAALLRALASAQRATERAKPGADFETLCPMVEPARQLLTLCRRRAEDLFARLPADGPARPPDALKPADDEAVVQGLARNPASFAAAPRLPGRRPETGAYARQGASVGLSEAAARLHARLADLGAAVDALGAPACSARLALIGSGRPGPGEGWAAVETGRGRLHHWARLGEEGRVAAYGILAPTDWNFAPDGPFAAALERLIARDPAALETSIALLARLFDPCVSCRVHVREPDNA
jgi:hypothetical protein